MEELMIVGLSLEDIKSMIERNENIKNLEEQEIKEKIDVLKEVGCRAHHIKNILFYNPFYLNQPIKEVKELIEELTSFGLTNLYTVLEEDPFLLNHDKRELESFIKAKQEEGISLDDKYYGIYE